MFRHRRLLVAVGASCAALIAGCGGSSDTASKESSGGGASGTVTIGFIGDLTGPAAPDQGIPQLNGIKAAISYLNSSGQKAKNVTYKVVTRDAHSDANVAAASARELASGGKVTAIMGGGDDAQEQAMQSTINRQKVLNFTPVEAAAFLDELGSSKANPWVFQVSESPEQVVEPLVRYLSAGGKTIGEIYPDYGYGQTQNAETKKIAQSLGAKVLTESAPATATSFTAQLQKLKSAGADNLLIWLFGPAATGAMQNLQQLGWSPSVAGPLGIDNTTVIGAMSKSVASRAATGPFPNTFLSDSGNEKLTEPALQFYENYSKLAGDKAINGRTIVGSYGFDEVLLLNAAIKATNSSDPTKLRDYLASGAAISGARGTYRFGADKRFGVLGDQFGIVALGTPCSGGSKCKKQQ